MYLKLPYFMDLKARFDEKFKSLTRHFQSHPRQAKKLRSFADDFFRNSIFKRQHLLSCHFSFNFNFIFCSFDKVSLCLPNLKISIVSQESWPKSPFSLFFRIVVCEKKNACTFSGPPEVSRIRSFYLFWKLFNSRSFQNILSCFYLNYRFLNFYPPF